MSNEPTTDIVSPFWHAYQVAEPISACRTELHRAEELARDGDDIEADAVMTDVRRELRRAFTLASTVPRIPFASGPGLQTLLGACITAAAATSLTSSQYSALAELLQHGLNEPFMTDERAYDLLEEHEGSGLDLTNAALGGLLTGTVSGRNLTKQELKAMLVG